MFVLCEISGEKNMNKYNEGKKLEFTVFLSIDYVYSVLLNYMGQNYS